MAYEELYNFGLDNPFVSSFLGGFAGVLVGIGILIAVIFSIALYVYFALALSTVAKKLKHKNSWLAWIPFANLALILQLGRFSWAWIFLILIPFLGWIALFVLLVIASWKIFERRNYPGWFSLSLVIPQVGFILYLVAIGFAAWKDKKRK